MSTKYKATEKDVAYFINPIARTCSPCNTTVQHKSNPDGQKFNLLNISDDLYQQYLASGGGFFKQVNGPWIDAAVVQKVDILVVTDIKNLKNIYNTKIVDGKPFKELTGFGKEIHRLEWKHGFRFDPNTMKMVPPERASGLTTITKAAEYTH